MSSNEGGEKTEEATPRQLEKAREEGNVAKSRELTAGVMLLAVTLFLYFYFPYIVKSFRELFIEFYQFENFSLTQDSLKQLFFICLFLTGKVLLPLFLILYVVVFMIEAAQVGLQISAKAIEPKWERINFFTALPKFFQLKRKLVELFKSLFKIIVLGYVGIKIINNRLNDILPLTDADYMDSATFMMKLLFEIVFKMSILVILLGAIDLAYQRWQRRQDLKMTKQQIKEEYKQMEGDPLVRQRIRETQRELARKRMMEDVPNADVVITNPIHYAIALKYDSSGVAPVVVAKGQRLMAIRIKDIAIEHGIYIHEDRPLAQTLYKSVEIGDEIPENLYRAVAEILAIVYNMRNDKKPL